MPCTKLSLPEKEENRPRTEPHETLVNTRNQNDYQVDIPRQKWYLESMNRKETAIYRLSDRRNDDFVPGTPADRISLVWPLTREVASLSKKYDVEQRLQRHITRLVRRKG